MPLIQCNYEQHAAAMLAMFNDAIRTSTALYEYQERSMTDMANWFANKHAGQYPILGIENDQGVLMGFASYGPFRAFPAFKYTVEHAIYVAADCRGQGLGEQLLSQLILTAEQDGRHTMIGAIDTNNHGSIALHKKLGFSCNGILPQVGFKFGRWLDLALYQKTLATPDLPVDG
ncbi:GNAT family N-acetyltransferase [Chitinibacter sp. SCUT-21]|uniref:GNAT family N-acetyltransferase n=1 Tax=Chitinibacter sp. SCUT-21 TaxID=2970891 RepID=UPI0035A6538B